MKLISSIKRILALTVILAVFSTQGANTMGFSLNPANWSIIDQLQGQEVGPLNPNSLTSSFTSAGGTAQPTSTSNGTNYAGTPITAVESVTDTPEMTPYWFNTQSGQVMDGDQQVTNLTYPSPAGIQAQQQAQAKAQAQNDEKAYWQDQTDYLNSLLGSVRGKLGTGLSNIANKFSQTTSDINDQESKANRDYMMSRQNNEAEKQKGVQGVDNFANNSFTSLQRLLQGGNAGRSSVARDLIPTLVARSAGARRQGVYDTAGKNEMGIDIAQEDTASQLAKTRRDAEAERLAREESFKTGITQQEQDILNKLYSSTTNLDMAGGDSYETARNNRQNYRQEADSKNAYLDQLFNQYAIPAFNANPVTSKVPELSKYTVDPAKIQSQTGGVSSEFLPYLPSAKKKAMGL